MNKRFAFDLGTTSVGWAVFEANGDHVSKVVDAGVRVFDEPREPKTKTSNAVARRQARALRRQIRRRVTRRRLIINLCKKYGWLSPDARPPYGFSNNPYQLRKDSLTRPLHASELSEVFFNLSKRRGFKSNRKTDRASTEANQIVTEANQIKAEMENTGARTLGEYLANLYAKDPQTRIRCKKTLRQMYLDEFAQITEAQLKLKSKLLTADLIAEISKVIFHQLPFELQPEKRLKTLGKCPLIPTEVRAYVYDPVAIEFRIRKTVNNIRIIDQRNGTERTLGHEEREKIAFELLENPKLTFEKVKKLLGALSTQLINLETTRTDHIKGDPYYAAIVKGLGKKYDASLKNHIQDLCSAFHEATTPGEAVVLSAQSAILLKLDEKEVESLFAAFPLGSDGTTAYSRQAMLDLIPELMHGKSEYASVLEKFPPLADTEVQDLLPLPRDRITNPTVNRAVHQLRRVYNALVTNYGKPDSVVIELAKEIKKSEKQKTEEAKRQKLREKERERLGSEIKSLGIEPSRDLILRMELAEEQGFVCPYTGKAFGKADVIAEGRLEVDHILPFSRSLDDSKNNLVLVYAKSNAEKGNKTPGEWLVGDQHERLIERISKMRFGFSKKKKFYVDASADIDSFISQQLNDTRYISKFVREYISLTIPNNERLKRVKTIRGSHTAWLRKLWGMNHFLGDSGEKNRNDLRHHAIDAVVIGLSNSTNLKKLALARGGYDTHFSLTIPYPELHHDLKAILSRMIVSRMQTRKKSGPFHAETSYSPPKPTNKKGVVRVAHRVAVESISSSQIEAIIDPVIKSLVTERLKSVGGNDLDEPQIKKLLKDGALQGLTMKSGVPIKKIRVEDFMREKTLRFASDRHTKKIYRTVVNDGNYSLSLVPDLKKGLIATVASIHDATIGNTPKHSRLTLHKGDSVLVKNFGVGYVRKISVNSSDGPYVEIDLHNIAVPDKSAVNVHFKRFTSCNKLLEEVTPVSISLLGKP
jgi:CRISPR-associated endonuclease Csn1